MNIISAFSSVILPCLMLLLSLILLKPKTNLFDSFVDGAKSGLETAVGLLPTLLLIMCGVNMLFASGSVDLLIRIFSPVLSVFGIPHDMLPTLLLRPFSGSGATAVAGRLFSTAGPDSEASKMSAVLMGSTDTIIYTLALYFSAAKIKETRHAAASSFVVFIFSVFICIVVSRLILL